MPRKLFLNYDKGKMICALEDIENGMSVKSASKKYCIPRTTLIRHHRRSGDVPSIGRKTAFNKEQETYLTHWLIKMAKAGFPMTKGNFLASVTKYTASLNVKFCGSVNWYKSFMKRHKILSLRAYQNLTKSRANVTIGAIHNWFEEVETYLIENGHFHILKEPRRVFNADESAFYLNPKGDKVLAERGSKFVYLANANDEKENVTVLLNANAIGEFAPPMAVFRYKRMPEKLASSMPDSWTIGRSENGWMTQETMFEYVANYFHPWLIQNNIELPIIFFLDGHVSHMSLNLAEFCWNNGIILVALYPNATHLIQPMDVAVFKGLKVQWKKKVQEWRIDNEFREMKKVEFCPLLEKALQDFNKGSLSNGFKKCGLIPWNRYAVEIPLVNQEPAQPKLPSIVSSSTENSFLTLLEEKIGEFKLAQFKMNSGEWKGVLEDKSLYDLWLRSTTTNVATPTVNTNQSPFDAVDPASTASSDGDQTAFEPSIETGTEKAVNCSELDQHTFDLVEPTPGPSTDLNFILPSPFKKNVLFRNGKPSTITSNVRMPAVISSPEARKYMLKKEENKKALLKRREDARKVKEEKKAAKVEENRLKKLKREEKSKKKKMEGARKKLFSESDSDGEVNYSGSSSGGEWQIDSENESKTSDALPPPKKEVGEYVAIKYDDAIFVGVITEVSESGARVKAMKRNGKLWKWPEREDVFFYEWNDVIGHLQSPKKFSTRRDIFSVTELEHFV